METFSQVVKWIDKYDLLILMKLTKYLTVLGDSRDERC